MKPGCPFISRRQFLATTGLSLVAGLGGQALAATGKNKAHILPHEARFYEPLPDRFVQCTLCPRRCQVPPGQRGECGVRENRDGTYYSLVYGLPCALNVDPIEKKPLFHVYPGSKAFSIATAGCNIHCQFCQNWDISQSRPDDVVSMPASPEAIVATAQSRGARTIAYTYSEPTIFYEFMADCARAGKAAGIESVVITNGFISAPPQEQLFPLVKAIKIDLKAFTEKFYAGICQGALAPVLESLQRIKRSGTWLEIVVLLIPTLNDSPEELKRMTGWIVKTLGPDVPLHFTRFHPTYKLRHLPPTPPETLLMARQIALDAGCHFAYTGNVPGLEGENTLCPSCHKTVVRRYGLSSFENKITGQGKCGYCAASIPGVWS